jgi:S1-C subfamily serine protease
VQFVSTSKITIWLCGLMLLIPASIANAQQMDSGQTDSEQTSLQQASDAEDPLAAIEAYQQRLFEKIAPSVIFISQSGGFGSGFFVNEQGLALTNKHVVGQADTVVVVLRDGRKFEAEVVERAAEGVDLALIQVPVDSSPALELSGFRDLRVGSWVASVGHGTGGIWTFTRGMVSNIYPSTDTRPIFQTQIPLNPGASGGPVFDRRGRVVGVVTSGVVSSNSVNFAIRSDVALGSLAKLSAECRCLTVHAPEGVPIFVDGEMIGKGPRVRVTLSEGSHEVFAVIGGEMHKETIAYPKVREISLRPNN